MNLDISRRLYRSTQSRMLAGVCGGVAEYFKVDPTIVRVVWVIGTFLIMPIAPLSLLLYVILALLVPPAPLD